MIGSRVSLLRPSVGIDPSPVCWGLLPGASSPFLLHFLRAFTTTLMVFVPWFRSWLRRPSSGGSHLLPLRAGGCGDSICPLSCSSVSSSGSHCVACPTFSSCGFLNFFYFSYVLTDIFFFLSLYSSSFVLCVVGYLFLWGLLARRDTWVPAGLFLLALVSTRSFYGLVPRRLVSSLFQNNRHSAAWPCLPHSWDPPAFWLRRWLLMWDCRWCDLVQFQLFCTFASHLTVTGTWLANCFSGTLPVAFAHDSVFYWCISRLLVCSPIRYHVLFYGTSLLPG